MKYTVKDLYFLWAEDENYGPIYQLLDYWMDLIDSIDETTRAINGVKHQPRNENDDEARSDRLFGLVADALNYAIEQSEKLEVEQ